MVCVLALLFPVISLTDDLHPETAVVDAASGKRNASLIAASASHVRSATVSHGTHFAMGIISRPFPALHLALSEFHSRVKSNKQGYLASNTPARSPPSLS